MAEGEDVSGRGLPRIVIEIEGGCLRAVYAEIPVLVTLVDWDNIRQGDSVGEFESHPVEAMPDETRAVVALCERLDRGQNSSGSEEPPEGRKSDL